VRRQEQLGVADSASEAQQAGLAVRRREAKDPRRQVAAEGAHRGPGEVRLRKAGIELLMVFEFPGKNLMLWLHSPILPVPARDSKIAAALEPQGD